MDAVTHDLRQELAVREQEERLDEWREEQIEILAESILRGDADEFWDLGPEVDETLADMIHADDQQEMIQLIIAAADAADAKLTRAAKRYFKVIQDAAYKMAAARFKDATPEKDDE